MNIQLLSLKEMSRSPSQADQATLFFVCAQDEKNIKKLPQIIKKSIQEDFFKGHESQGLFLPFTASQNTKHTVLVGLKEKDHSSIRQACGYAYKILAQHKIQSIQIDLSLAPFTQNHENIRALVEGFILSSYSFDDYKQKKKNSKKQLSQITLYGDHSFVSKFKAMKKDLFSHPLKEAQVLSQATNFARFLGDHPGNLMTPSILAETIRKKVQKSSIKVTIWNKDKIIKEKMGGLLGVSLGSFQEPRFIIMEYKGAKSSVKPIYFVGKGLTFDCGGISIKPSPNMDEMKYDMCGGAVVAGALLALSELKLKVNVVGLIPSSENMPGSQATKPGDILKARNGKTMEVLNTDAEGRLILADALSYASEKSPQAIFDVATLTGAMVVALGNSHTGFYTRNDSLAKKIKEAGDQSGERVWHMPLVDDHAKDMESHFADVANLSSVRGAGSATAAAFLEHFVDKKIPWAHFDIAGTAWNVSKRLSYCKKGASGAMVRTFYEIARLYSK